MDLIQKRGVFDTIVNNKKTLNKRPEIHRVSVQSKLLEEVRYFPEVRLTKRENDELVHLEKIMDWHVLKSRMNDNNDNTVCKSRGNISEEYENEMKREKKKLRRKFWIDFPMVSMQNGFGIHWYYKQDKKQCKQNSFSLRDAVHYALNNVTYSYEDYEKLENDGVEKAFKRLMIEEAETTEELEGLRIGDYVQVINVEHEEYAKFGKLKKIHEDMEGEIGEGDYVLYKGSLQKIQAVYGDNIEIGEKEMSAEPFGEITGVDIEIDGTVMKNISIEDIGRVKRPWMLDQSEYGNGRIRKKFDEKYNDEEKIDFKDYDKIMKDKYKAIIWTERKVTSTFDNKKVTETLSFDSRLLEKKKLGIPLICIPSILRSGVADFHTVYLEGDNALGQLEKVKKDFAVVLIVRQEQKEVYAKRYYSDHTYFVALDPRSMYEDKGYSAGDSKFYAYRVANELYDLWNTPRGRGKRRVLIMDDQVQPFTHQIPIYSKNKKREKSNSIEPDKDTYLLEGELIRNDTYKFRSEFKDETGASMMFSGNSRFFITHAAFIMYMDKVADITGAGLVCASSDEAERTSMVLRTTPYKNIVWLFDLEKSKIPGFSAPIPPAYRAAEDTMMSNVLISHDIRVVTCNTMRFRKSVTGGGTSGRNKNKPKPFMPIIAYHELLRPASISPLPELKKGKIKGKKEKIDVGYPFEEFYAKYKMDDDYFIPKAIEFKFRRVSYLMKFDENSKFLVGPTIMGLKHPYGSRHRINLMALYGLKKILSEKKKPKNYLPEGTEVKVKWTDGKWYDGEIASFDDEEQKYIVLFPKENTYDLFERKNIKTKRLKF